MMVDGRRGLSSDLKVEGDLHTLCDSVAGLSIRRGSRVATSIKTIYERDSNLTGASEPNEGGHRVTLRETDQSHSMKDHAMTSSVPTISTCSSSNRSAHRGPPDLLPIGTSAIS